MGVQAVAHVIEGRFGPPVAGGAQRRRRQHHRFLILEDMGLHQRADVERRGVERDRIPELFHPVDHRRVGFQEQGIEVGNRLGQQLAVADQRRA